MHEPPRNDSERRCPRCGAVLVPGDPLVRDEDGREWHSACREGVRSGHGADVVIRASDLKEVEVETLRMPAGGGGPFRVARYAPRKTSRWAWAALVCALPAALVSAACAFLLLLDRPMPAGWTVPAGVLSAVAGMLAVPLGVVALASVVSQRALKGAGLAALGILLGSLSTAGWIWGGFRSLEERSPSSVREAGDFSRDAGFQSAPEEIRHALLANVRIDGESGFATSWIGSGVLLSAEGGKARILTNRHVAFGGIGKADSDLTVTFHDGSVRNASVEWTAPGETDLAVLSCPLPRTVPDPAVFASAAPRVGDEVFAVGNPQGLGWTYTRGSVSGLRTLEEDPSVKIIQTQTPLNEGNSGGGLYSADGRLIGVVTWSWDKRVAEGLSFAISTETYRALRGE